jgi:hypothetical protein
MVLVALMSFGAGGVQSQVSVGFSIAAGPLFTGVSFGVGGPVYSSGSVFYGSAFGSAHPHYAAGYGIYSGRSHYAASCYDAYWYTYDHCVISASYD